MRFALLVVLALACALLTSASVQSAAAPAVRVAVSGSVAVNGRPLVLRGSGSIDPARGAYAFHAFSASGGGACAGDRALALWLPRAGLALLVRVGADSLLGLAGGRVALSIDGVPKRDLASGVDRLDGAVRVVRTETGVHLDVTGEVATAKHPCRPLETGEGSAEGGSVLRLGLRRDVVGGRFVGGSFVGVARLDYATDPAALGRSDFWNLTGSYTVSGSVRNRPSACGATSCAAVTADVASPQSALAGRIFSFRSSAVTMRAVITYKGDAPETGFFHKHVGIASVAGGSPLIAHFNIPVKKGDSAAIVAHRTADLMNSSTAGFKGGGHLLSVQGGTGVGRARPNAKSPFVAVCETLDGSSCASPSSAAAQRVYPLVGTQVFASVGVHAYANSELDEQFGQLNAAPLVGWLTPFKAIFFTDNPATGRLAAGGSVTIGVMTCRSSAGALCDPGTTMGVKSVRVATTKGEDGQRIAAAVVSALERRGITCIERVGAKVIMDAGLEMPSILALKSEDRGVGYATQAADIPTMVEPHTVQPL